MACAAAACHSVMRMPDDVMAVVVSYNGGNRIEETVAALISQVAQVYVVDNGSDSHSRDQLRNLSCSPNVTVEYLGRNYGVAAALNRGIRRARSGGFEWLLTMDQDSCLHAGAVERMLQCAKSTEGDCVVTTRTETDRTSKGECVSEAPFAITSGNLVPVRLFDVTGDYEEALFIDGVDIDFSMRLRNAGVKILRPTAAVMTHRLGEEDKIKHRSRIGLRKFHTIHSPVRRYYLVRNHCWLIRRHGARHPAFMLRLSIALFLSIMSLLLYGPRRRKSMIYMTRGLADGVLGRWGSYDDNWATVA